MAERRMFAKTIIDSDAFLDMPMSAQALYFHLGMRADDDGFVNAPRKIQRTVGASEDDLRLLVAKRFILVFDSGVIVIKHWRIHNYIQKDRYKPTLYKNEMETLMLNDNNAYTERNRSIPEYTQVHDSTRECIQDVSKMETQDRLGKESIGKDSLVITDQPKQKRFSAPTVDEIADYCRERHNSVDPQRFYDYYASKGWVVGKSPMKDWKAAVRTWEQREPRSKNGPTYTPNDSNIAKYAQELKQRRAGK